MRRKFRRCSCAISAEGRPACDRVSGDAGKGNFHMNDQPTVVIADDNVEILEAVGDLLSGSFRIVAQVGDGLEAFRAINEHTPQLAVLDLSMPKMNGMEVARWLSQATHPTKIVFLTLMKGDDFIREAKRYGHGFVAKSRLHSDLVPALYAAIEGEFFVSDLSRKSQSSITSSP
jgi:DNA-binding NarL/FixJ family response regulator